MAWIEPITDRTLIDVDYARNNRDSLQNLKGSQNISDYNRLTGNMYYLVDELNKYGYCINITCKKNWYITDSPHVSFDVNTLQLVLDDVNRIRNGFFVKNTTPPTPILPLNYYQKINDLEQITQDLYDILNNILDVFVYCGDFYAGGNQ